MAKPDWEKRARFAEAYADSGNATQAALSAGVPQSSAHSMGYRWLRDPQVTEMIRNAMNDRLKALGPQAVGVIEELLLSENVSPQLRLQAARDVLDRLGWVPPKRPDPISEPAERELTELSRYELETLASGNPYIRLDDESLRAIACQS
ncbi:terminase small subunit [Phaeobacter italicus]|uniref:terminase small subunit n=1 Tax=Phaeobacter italicus TaxID=481446 RepID=UPI001CD43B9E|nr:terminase small subunit [Phaeobacter italicus]MCA0857824.1 terminase small subunit [Phaeobacter italicus]